MILLVVIGQVSKLNLNCLLRSKKKVWTRVLKWFNYVVCPEEGSPLFNNDNELSIYCSFHWCLEYSLLKCETASITYLCHKYLITTRAVTFPKTMASCNSRTQNTSTHCFSDVLVAWLSAYDGSARYCPPFDCKTTD